MNEDKLELRGMLWVNQHKEADDNRPHMKGVARINGVDWDVAGWSEEKDGEKRLSLKFQVPRERTPKERTPPPASEDRDDLPF